MELRTYLNSLTPDEQRDFATRCGTTIGYLRKGLSKGQRFGPDLVVAFERESGGKVPCEATRSDVDWGFIRGTEKKAA